MDKIDSDKLNAVRLMLLQGKTWRYLRYLHFREALKEVAANGIETVALPVPVTDWRNSPARWNFRPSISR
jgi:hypothetical protein